MPPPVPRRARRLSTLLALAGLLSLTTAGVAAAGPDPAAAVLPDRLVAGQELTAGAALHSPSQAYTLAMQADGNLVEYTGSRALWWTGTAGAGARAVLQADGNLVVYAGATALWSSRTDGSGATTLALQDDGNVVLYAGGPVWASSTRTDVLHRGQQLSAGASIGSSDGRHLLAMQDDGNLVVYAGTTPLWWSRTSGSGAVLVFQGDGNVVVYGPTGTPLFQTGTAGSRADTLAVQDDGNVVLYAAGTPLWWSAGLPLSGRTVVLDAGHSGGDPADPRLSVLVPAGGFLKPCNTSGTQTGAGYPEHAFTYDVVQRAAALLRARGATVVLTRQDDTTIGPCVDQRAAIGNAAGAAAVVAVHADGELRPGARGFHVIAPGLSPDGGNPMVLAPSYQLALTLRSAFQSATGEPYANYTATAGLTQRSDLAGLNLSRVPAVFLECGNMRDPVDAAFLSSPDGRQRAAEGIATALERYVTGG